MKNQTKTQITLHMGQWAVSRSQEESLVSPCLGSCVALCLYSPENKIGAMAHVVLPNRNISLTGKNLHPYPDARYAEEALTILLDEIFRIVGQKDISIKAKLAGGAQMFKGALSRVPTLDSNQSSSTTKKGFPLIGYKNIVAIKQELLKVNIQLVSNDLGGDHGRTVSFDPLSGEMLVRKIGQSQELLL